MKGWPKAKELKAIYSEWAGRCGVLPWNTVHKIDQEMWMKIYGKPMSP